MKNNFFRFFVLVAVLCLTGFGVLLLASRAADTPSSWGFATTNLDKSCKPCEDFYQFAMGGWMKNNPIPPDYSTWGTFSELADKNQTSLRQIAEDSASAKALTGSNQQKVGDLYASCMNTAAIGTVGTKPLAPEMASIEAMQSHDALLAVVAHLHREGVRAVFLFGSTQDLADSTQVTGDAAEGGLGLPDRDYYVRSDDRSNEHRVDY